MSRGFGKHFSKSCIKQKDCLAAPSGHNILDRATKCKSLAQSIILPSHFGFEKVLDWCEPKNLVKCYNENELTSGKYLRAIVNFKI